MNWNEEIMYKVAWKRKQDHRGVYESGESGGQGKGNREGNCGRRMLAEGGRGEAEGVTVRGSRSQVGRHVSRRPGI